MAMTLTNFHQTSSALPCKYVMPLKLILRSIDSQKYVICDAETVFLILRTGTQGVNSKVEHQQAHFPARFKCRKNDWHFFLSFVVHARSSCDVQPVRLPWGSGKAIAMTFCSGSIASHRFLHGIDRLASEWVTNEYVRGFALVQFLHDPRHL
jgi:hypothetical protein